MAAADDSTTTKPARSRAKTFEPRVVHAYRRLPHMSGKEELAVPVVFGGEKVMFKSNEAGHIVGTVTNEATFKRLVEEIPEAYIEYKGGDNIPEERVEPGPVVPDGDFVLTNGTESVVLDDMDDAQLNAFAIGNGVVDLHASLAGDALRRAIWNTLTQK